MSNDKDQDHSYLAEVRRQNREYIEGILEELKKSRQLITHLEHEIMSHKEDKLQLQSRLLDLREELERRDAEKITLHRELLEIEHRNDSHSEDYVLLEQQNTNLANLYIASYQLHGTLNRDEVIATIKEIVINFIGSEQVAIFEMQDGVLRMVGSFGVPEGSYEIVQLGEGLIGRVAASGDSYTRDGDIPSGKVVDENEIVACIPLRIEGRTTGAIVVFSLLQQKTGLESLDFELFDLLQTHASTALYCAGLHQRETSRREDAESVQ